MVPKRCDNCGKKLGGTTGRGIDDSNLCAKCRYIADRKVDAPLAEKEAARKREQWQRLKAEQAAEAADHASECKLKFLTELLRSGGLVEQSCTAAGISRAQIGNYRDEDPDFALAWEAIQETNVERLESEADRRALGYEEPVVYQGQKMGRWVTPEGKPASMADDDAVFIPTTVTKYSDNLLMFRLKALRPEKYRDGPNVAGRSGAQLSENELNEALTKMMARRTKQQGVQVDQVSDAEQ